MPKPCVLCTKNLKPEKVKFSFLSIPKAKRNIKKCFPKGNLVSSQQYVAAIC